MSENTMSESISLALSSSYDRWIMVNTEAALMVFVMALLVAGAIAGSILRSKGRGFGMGFGWALIGLLGAIALVIVYAVAMIYSDPNIDSNKLATHSILWILGYTWIVGASTAIIAALAADPLPK